MSKIDLKNLTPAEIEKLCTEELRQKPGQGTRLAIRLFRRKIEDLDLMIDLSKAFRDRLKECCMVSSLTISESKTADDGTRKLLYRLEDGNSIEGVLISGPGRLTLCVSTQVGCASGCGFCLTGSGGFIRNLAPAEMVNQVFAAGKLAHGQAISNIVLMGTGEPLSNYEAVKKFVAILTDQNGMGYSPKKVTLSTCGIAPMIERMATEMDVSLAVSLNATTDEVRSRLMPINKTYPIHVLMRSLHLYCKKTGNTVTIEYVLFKGINDSDEDAHRLIGLLKDLPCMINILMFNPYPGCAFERPDEERAYTFRNILLNSGYVAVVRSSRGRDIHAACGQLRSTSSSSDAR